MFSKSFAIIFIVFIGCGALASAKSLPELVSLLPKSVSDSSPSDDDTVIVKRQQNPDDAVKEITLQQLLDDLEDSLVKTALKANDGNESISLESSSNEESNDDDGIQTTSQLAPIEEDSSMGATGSEGSLNNNATETSTTHEILKKDVEEAVEELKEKVAEIEAEPVILSARV